MKNFNLFILLIKIWTVGHKIESGLDLELNKIGYYSPVAFFIMAALEDYPYPSQLADALTLPSPTVSFIVKKLEKSGFIVRSMEKTDLRRYRLTITEKGKFALNAGQEVMNKKARSLFNKFSESELEEFRKLISILPS